MHRSCVPAGAMRGAGAAAEQGVGQATTGRRRGIRGRRSRGKDY